MRNLILLIAVLVLNTGHSQIFTSPTGNEVSMSVEDGLLRINRAFYGILTTVEDLVGFTVSESTAEFYRLDAYSALYGHSPGTGQWFGTPDNHLFDMMSDDALKGTDAGDQPDMSLLETYQWTGFNSLTSRNQGLHSKMSHGIESVENSMRILGQNPPQSDHDMLIAELKFLRAHFRFELKRVFNEGSWSAIELDYLDAIPNLPTAHGPSWPKGRPTMLMARAMLGKAHLYQRDWSNALSQFNIVISSGTYSLRPQFKQIWSSLYERNDTEGIFTVNFQSRSSGYSGDWSMGSGINYESTSRGLNHPYITPWGCCGFFQANQDIVDFFQTTSNGLPKLDGSWKSNHITNPNGASVGEPIGNPSVDPRLDWTVGRPGILYNNHHIYQIDYVRDLTYAGPYFTKKHIGFPEEFGIQGWGNITAVNHHILRYADLLLMAAEASVELGDLETARGYVNQIRMRASNPLGFVPEAIQGGTRVEYTTTSNPAANYNISQYTTAWTSQAEARTAVRYERRLELAHEGHRMFDLWRWGNARGVLNDYLSRESRYRAYLQGVRYSQPNHLPSPASLN